MALLAQRAAGTPAWGFSWSRELRDCWGGAAPAVRGPGCRHPLAQPELPKGSVADPCPAPALAWVPSLPSTGAAGAGAACPALAGDASCRATVLVHPFVAMMCFWCPGSASLLAGRSGGAADTAVPGVMHNLVLALAWGGWDLPRWDPPLPTVCLHPPACAARGWIVPAAGGKAAAGISLVYESTKLSQQAFSIPFICVSPLSSFYFP